MLQYVLRSLYGAQNHIYTCETMQLSISSLTFTPHNTMEQFEHGLSMYKQITEQQQTTE